MFQKAISVPPSKLMVFIEQQTVSEIDVGVTRMPVSEAAVEILVGMLPVPVPVSSLPPVIAAQPGGPPAVSLSQLL